MTIAAPDPERIAVELQRIYAESERVLIERIARRLARGIHEEGYYERKLTEVQALLRETQEELARLRGQAHGRAARAITDSYAAGADQAGRELDEAGIKVSLETGFGRTPELAVEALVRETLTRLQAPEQAIFRWVEDAYREAVTAAVGPAVVGVETRRDAAQRVLNDLAARGITGFVDGAGRRWDLDVYASMSTRTAVQRAYLAGHTRKLIDHGYDLVMVSQSPEPCPRCDPWEHQVLSLTGATPDHPTLAEAQAAGLFHPSCTHRTRLYIPGLTKTLPRAEKEERSEAYALRQEQRGIERGIRRAKREEAAAMSQEAKALARDKVWEGQAAMRDFIERTGRFRRYDRESITRAH